MGLSTYHLSVDDVFDSLLPTARGTAEHPMLGFLESLHASFGVQVDLYLFGSKTVGGQRRSLADVCDHLADRLARNPWLRLGPHAADPDTRPCDQTPAEQAAAFDAIYGAIDRLAGPGRRSRQVRLHYFSESYELADYFAANGVEALFTTDRPALAYRLPQHAREQLRRHQATDFAGMRFMRSHLRAEDLAAAVGDAARFEALLRERLPPEGCAVVFTHEVELERQAVRDAVTLLLSRFARMGATSIS